MFFTFFLKLYPCPSIEQWSIAQVSAFYHNFHYREDLNSLGMNEYIKAFWRTYAETCLLKFRYTRPFVHGMSIALLIGSIYVETCLLNFKGLHCLPASARDPFPVRSKLLVPSPRLINSCTTFTKNLSFFLAFCWPKIRLKHNSIFKLWMITSRGFGSNHIY